jgi:hypothetical protein
MGEATRTGGVSTYICTALQTLVRSADGNNLGWGYTSTMPRKLAQGSRALFAYRLTATTSIYEYMFAAYGTFWLQMALVQGGT